MVLKWNDQALAAVRTLAPPPPVTARALAIMNTSIYDAWTAYDATAVPTIRAGWARRPAAEHLIEYKSMAISYAAERALATLFSSQANTFSGFRTALGYTATPTGQPDDPATIASRPPMWLSRPGPMMCPTRPEGYAETSVYAPTSPPGPLCLAAAAGHDSPSPTGSGPHSRSARPPVPPPGPGLKKSDGSYDKATRPSST